MKNGDIIELENGDIMEVTLTKIGSKIKELKMNGRYRLNYTGQFCSMASSLSGDHIKHTDVAVLVSELEWIFVGNIDTENDIFSLNRNIFYSKGRYVMFGCDNLDYVVSEVK